MLIEIPSSNAAGNECSPPPNRVAALAFKAYREAELFFRYLRNMYNRVTLARLPGCSSVPGNCQSHEFIEHRKIATMRLRAISIAVVLGILLAGLWPLHVPRNEVSWLSDGEGLFFGNLGSVVSSKPFRGRVLREGASCSLEIGLEPSRVDADGIILSFYRPRSRAIPFEIRQFQNGLVLELGSDMHSGPTIERYVGKIFEKRKPILLTITSDRDGTSTYVNGTLVGRLSDFIISNRDMTGQLLIGNAPSVSYTWSGRVEGLAIYDRELSPGEVSTSFIKWSKGRRLDSISDEAVVASYPFDERTGNVAHNQVDAATDIVIPQKFFVLDKQFLQRPWTEFRLGWIYWKNATINILGFIPLGVFVGAYLSQLERFEHSAAITVALGFLVSLIIEVLQAFLPTRDSGMTDIITNTLGTAVGVTTLRFKVIPPVLSRMAFGGNSNRSG
jgi:VanZ like family/Concanavalin A-like lectin/glucanases superfamily